MGITTAAMTVLAKLLKGDTQTLFNNGNAYIGVGDSNTAFSAAQTDLQAVSNKTRAAMDATFPTRSGAALTFQSTFGTGVGNHAWEEWGVFNASSAGDMLSRKVESLGTKTSAQSWQFSVTLTMTAA